MFPAPSISICSAVCLPDLRRVDFCFLEQPAPPVGVCVIHSRQTERFSSEIVIDVFVLSSNKFNAFLVLIVGVVFHFSVFRCS